MNKTKVMISGE